MIVKRSKALLELSRKLHLKFRFFVTPTCRMHATHKFELTVILIFMCNYGRFLLHVSGSVMAIKRFISRYALVVFAFCWKQLHFFITFWWLIWNAVVAAHVFVINTKFFCFLFLQLLVSRGICTVIYRDFHQTAVAAKINELLNMKLLCVAKNIIVTT